MRPNNVKTIWREGRNAVAGWLSTADLYNAEIMANAGFDALVIDMQHGLGIGVDRAAAVLQVISTTQTVPFVRVPWNDPVFLQYVLDAGAYGVIVPLVSTPEEAAKAGGACRYPPNGFRSAGLGRTRFYGGPDYFQRANDELICLVMIETEEALNNLEAIAKAPGIDGFYIGPNDLALSLGIANSGGTAHPRHQEARRRVVEVARANGLVPCSHAASPEEALARFEEGFRFCPIGSDVGLIASGAKAALDKAKG